MGANLSSTHEGHVPTKRSQVVVFHSSAKWKIHFEASKASNKLMVIDFSAGWCEPCRHIEPVFRDLATKYPDVEYIKIDADECADVAEEFKVDALPTFIFIRKGKEVEKIVGAKKEELERKIEKHRV